MNSSAHVAFSGRLTRHAVRVSQHRLCRQTTTRVCNWSLAPQTFQHTWRRGAQPHVSENQWILGRYLLLCVCVCVWVCQRESGVMSCQPHSRETAHVKRSEKELKIVLLYINPCLINPLVTFKCSYYKLYIIIITTTRPLLVTTIITTSPLTKFLLVSATQSYHYYLPRRKTSIHTTSYSCCPFCVLWCEAT